MRKPLIIFLSLALLITIGFGTVWVVKHPGKTRMVMNNWFNDGTVISDYTERVRLEKELDSLNAKFKRQEELFKTLSELPDEPEKTDGKVTELNREIGELKSENAELRRELDQIKSLKSEPIVKNYKKNEKKSSEKPLPIARNSSAAELQKFLTDLYGNR